MSLFNILTISATADYGTTNSNGVVIPANIQGSIWDLHGPSYNDGVDGSIAPVTFRFPATGTNSRIKLALNANFVFSQAQVGGTYVIAGGLPGVDDAIFLSDQFPISAPGSQLVGFANCVLKWPEVTTQLPALPERCAGDFVWVLIVSQAGQPSTRECLNVKLASPWPIDVC